MKKLEIRQAKFVKEYVIDLNGTQAAIRAGYSPKTANPQAARLLAKPSVQAALEKEIAKLAARTEITQDRVLKELAKIGFSDLRKAVTWRANVIGMVQDEDGEERLAVTNEVQLVDSDKLDEETAGAIAEISQTEKGGLRLKMHDKRGALEAMGRHLGMFTDKLKIEGQVGIAAAPLPTDPNEASRAYQKFIKGA